MRRINKPVASRYSTDTSGIVSLGLPGLEP